MAPEAALTKKPEKDKQPESKNSKSSGSAHLDVIEANGGKPDFLDHIAGAWQKTGTAITTGVQGVKKLIGKDERKSYPDPRLEGKGKPHENYDRPNTESSLQSGDGSMQ